MHAAVLQTGYERLQQTQKLFAFKKWGICMRIYNALKIAALPPRCERPTAIKRAMMEDASALKGNLKLCLDSRYRFAPSTATSAAL